MFPQQLINNEFRLIKIDRTNKKKPLETSWNTIANYPPIHDEINKWVKEGNNYGVATGFGNLIVIDCDNQQLQDLIDKEFPQTFQVKTGGRGYHNYYILQGQQKIIFEHNGVHLGELQSQGQQVIGPGCTHPNGNKYTITKDIPITVLNNGIIKEKIPEEYIKGSNKNQTFEYPQHTIKHNINIMDVIQSTNLKKRPNGEYQGEHPIHGSNTGMNFTVNPSKNVWHCFRHNVGGDPISWIGIQEGIIQCGDKLDGENFKKVIEIAKSKYGYVEHTPEQIKEAIEKKDFGALKEMIKDAILQKDRDTATELLVDQIKSDEYIYTIIDDEKPEMWTYSEGIYIPNGESRIKEICREILGEMSSPQLTNRVIFKIQTDTFIEQQDFFNKIIKEEIVTMNGVLNLKTRELRPYSPQPMFFTKIPVHYNPEAQCPNIINFLGEVLKSTDDLPIIQELFGYLLWKEYNIERAIMFIGSGRNGKGKTMELMKRFIGFNNYSSVSLQNLETDHFSQVDLHNKLANLCGDIDDRALKFTSSFKNLTGRDTITADRKFKTVLHFENFAKLVFAANQLPKTCDITDGFFMRWILLEFPYTFISQEEYNSISDVKQLEVIKVRDPNIINKIATTDELSGLLNWALDGLERLQAQKDFTQSKTVDQIKNIWIRKSDSFHAYCLDTLEEKYGNEIPKSEVRHTYNEYCKIHKLRPVTDKEIREELASLFGAYESKTTLDDGRVHVWVGIAYKPPPINKIEENKKL